MSFEPGDVVFLKSGGQPMTVIAKSEHEVECIWLGEEGDLFREAIPSVALAMAADLDEEDEEDDEEEHDEDEEEEEGSEKKSAA